MQSWSKVKFTSPNELYSIVGLARAKFADGVGVFKAREGLILYFSPIAKNIIPEELALSFVNCARPDELNVEVVVGPYDEPGWYDQNPDDIAYDLEILAADEENAFETVLLEDPAPRKIAS